MFIGHYALGFGAKRIAPAVSLGTLFLACQFADLLWPTLVLLGVEVVRIDPGNTVLTPLSFDSYPWSHSLVTMLAWSAMAAVAYWAMRARSGVVAAVVVGALVFSHWVLDAVTHRPDMPLAPGAAAKVGLGLWNHPAVAVPLEVGLFALGLWLYAGSTVAKDRTGTWALWSLVAFFAVTHTANLLSPPPPSVAAVAWSAQALWLVVAWGYWIDRHRVPNLSNLSNPSNPSNPSNL
jgi:hypothetical protein